MEWETAPVIWPSSLAGQEWADPEEVKSLMRRSRICVLAAAILVAGAGGIAAATPAAAGRIEAAKPAAARIAALPTVFSLINVPTLRLPQYRCMGEASNHNVGIYNCTYTHDQAWKLGSELGTTGHYQLKNGYDQCLGIAGGSTALNAQVVGWTCLGPTHRDQYWALDPTGNAGQYYVFNYISPHVIGVQNGSTANGAPCKMQNWDINRTNSQAWASYPAHF